MASKNEHCVTFPLNTSGPIDGRDVVQGLRQYLSEEDIKCVQVTRTECMITLSNSGAKLDTCLKGITVNSRHITVRDTENEMTNITIKDLPVEVSNDFIATQLGQYGKLAQASLTKSLYRGTNIETGSRTAKLLKVEKIIPNEAIWGRYTVRLYCDNKKSMCIYCDSIDHMHYACPERRNKSIKRCHKCNLLGHLQKDCRRNRQPPPVSTEQKNVTAFRGEDNILSNLYRLSRPLTYKGKEHYSVEHGYKSIKCQFYGRDDLLPHINSIKRGKTVMNYVNDELEYEELAQENVEDWKSKQVEVMRDLLDAKHEACPEFREELQKTGNSILAEATSHMKWASGLRGFTQTIHTDPDKYPGENMMGKLLMELREKHKQTPDHIASEAKSTPETQAESAEVTPTKKQNADSDVLMNPPEAMKIGSPITSISDAVKALKDEASAPVNQLIEQPTFEEESDNDDTDQTILVVGDSILVDATHEDATVVAQSGAHLSDTEHLLHASLEHTQHKVVPSVVLALGANDITKYNDSSRVSAYIAKAAATATNLYPDATIYLSGILSRKGTAKETTQKNVKAAEVNKFMRDTVFLYPNVKYLNNSDVFMGKDIRKMYQSKDKSGVHLTQEGKDAVMKHIVSKVKETQKMIKKHGKRTRSQNQTPPSVERQSKILDNKITP